MTHSFPPRLSSDLIPAELSITDAATIHRVAREPRDQLADDARCDQRQAEIQADLIRLPAIRPPHERGIPGAGTGHDHRRESEAGVVIQAEAAATAHEAQQRRVVNQCDAPEVDADPLTRPHAAAHRYGYAENHHREQAALPNEE